MEIIFVLGSFFWSLVLVGIGLLGVFCLALASVVKKADENGFAGAARQRFILTEGMKRVRNYHNWMFYAAVAILVTMILTTTLKFVAVEEIANLDRRRLVFESAFL